MASRRRSRVTLVKQWWVIPGSDGGQYELREVAHPEPEPSQVVVAVRGAGVNRGELIGQPLMNLANPKARPRSSGIEFAGQITSVGRSVDTWSIGDRVMGRGTACHAEFVAVDAAALMSIPAEISFDEAAAIPNVFVTAHDAMMTAAAVSAGESILITAGSSGVGTAAIQIAANLPARHIVATTRSPAKAEELIALGATLVIDTTQPRWTERVSAATGGIDVVIDQVGGVLLGQCLETMCVEGRYVTVGRNGGAEATIDLDLVARQRLSIIGVTFRTRSPTEALACSARFVDDLLPSFEDGSLKPVLDRIFPLDELNAAHEYMRADTHIGKIVLVTG